MQSLLAVLLVAGCMGQDVLRGPAEAQQLKDYLYRYGYLPATDLENGVLRTELELEQATMRLQKFMGLDMTGKLDGPTMDMIAKPRCGIPDMEVRDDGLQGIVEVTAPANYTNTGRKWRTLPVTYGCVNYSPDLPQSTVTSIIDTAISKWTAASGLRCSKTTASSANMKISFGTGGHGCSSPFTGELAHAFYPEQGSISGDAHFNEYYRFTDGTSDYSLLFVATHEFGHSFGLGHSSNGAAIMYPTYHRLSVINLHSDDVNGIRAIYGNP